MIAVAVAMMFTPIIIAMFVLSIGLLRYTDRAPTEVSYAITGELSRGGGP